MSDDSITARIERLVAEEHQLRHREEDDSRNDARLEEDQRRLREMAIRFDHYAVQVALPLTSVDSVLHGLALTYALVVGGGVLFALLMGVAISRSALSPIERFLRRTEAVASDLEKPRRLEESGASELRRLAASFNRTLDALEHSIQAQRHLVADASHELRTPIAALRSNIQIFLEARRLPPHERENLQASILAELDELTQVVADA